MTGRLREFYGSCHCGAVGFTYRASRAPDDWAVRACQCSFCRAHGARTTCDPDGSVVFHGAGDASLQRYQFATRSADFLICGRCGVYLGAVLTIPAGRFATLNVNTMRDATTVSDAVSVSYEGESGEQRRTRREQRWTPVAGSA